jgi:hypothetical protein
VARGGLEYYRRKSEAVIGTMNELGTTRRRSATTTCTRMAQ